MLVSIFPAANLLSFIPSLGTREVFTFGSGVALPTRMRFQELPAAQRPNSEASGDTRSDAATFGAPLANTSPPGFPPEFR